MIKIEIESNEVKTKSGTALRTGKPYIIREQNAYAYTYGQDGHLKRHPAEIAIKLRDNQSPYPVGNYTLDPTSIYINRFDQLEINPILTPVAHQALKVA